MKEIENLDTKLNAPDQLKIRQAVSLLPDEAPSMVWRSRLNLEIQKKVAKKQARQRLWWIFTPSISVAAAACAGFFLFSRMPARHEPDLNVAGSGRIEESLATMATDSAISDEVTGEGLASHDDPSDEASSQEEVMP